MAPVIRIYRSGELISETEGEPGETLLNHIKAVGVYLDAPCGGQGKCGKCKVRLGRDGAEVPACRTVIASDTDVYLPEELKMEIASAGCAEGYAGAAKRPDHARLGVAIDIGTTTVVVHLIDTNTGIRVATASGVNAQRAYGADVISRIKYCAENGHETLTSIIREQLASLIKNACAVSGGRARDIAHISIAGNTIMEHIAAGYSPVSMGKAPFTPVSLFGGELPVWERLPVSPSADVFFAPAISAYVGGDTTAGLLAAELDQTQGPAVFIDIGTNGEIAMKRGDRYYCCATAAGPAFEGAEITMGMAAVSGAVDHVRWEGGLKFSVIGGSVPLGICGSGLLDALAVLLDTGAVDETGRLLDSHEIDHEIARHIDKVDGKSVFRLTANKDGVYMTGMDIRKLQLAKAAIAAGIQTLLNHVGIAETDVKLFVLAGGFGSYMDQHSAARIGMFPKSFVPVTRTMGNTAGEGATLVLCSETARDTLEDIRRRCEYVELSTSRVFNEQFVEQMMF